MQRKDQQGLTRHAIPDPDSESAGFVLAEDLPPEFVETSARYEILSELGRGGAGIVYQARDMALDRMVAVKVLRHELKDRPEIVKRFIQEARIICRLQHPGVAPVFDCGVCEDGRPFHAMKLVNGQTMLNLIKHGFRDSKIQSEIHSQTIALFALVCQTIAYTHSHQIVHLDLKPANFMVGLFGEVHVMDWGTARLLDDGRFESVGMAQIEKDRSRLVGGTLAYMSPEQARGGSLDKRSDVFGLGACLCQILTGTPPFVAQDTNQMFRMASDCQLDSVHEALLNCQADSALIRLTISCLQSSPANRLEDAGEVAKEISSYQDAAIGSFQSDMTRFFELSHDLFCIAGTDGFFRRINSNFSRVLGHSEQELLSRPFKDFVHPDDHQKTDAAMAMLSEGKPVIRFRNRYKTAAGRLLEFEWTAKSIPAENLIFAVARDVTDD